MNDQVVIRAATKDDFPMWKPLWDGYNAFYGRVAMTLYDKVAENSGFLVYRKAV